MLNIITDDKLNNRTIVSAIRLLAKFSVFDKSKTKKLLFNLLEKKTDTSFKARIIRLLELYVDEKDIELIIELFKTESNKAINSSILFLIQNQSNLDKYFDYIEKEFSWAHNIVPRNQVDDVIRGNEWVLKDYLLRFEDEDNFLNLASYYLDDFRLRTEKSFREKLIKRFQFFHEKKNTFFNRIIEKIDFDTNKHNRHNEEILILII